MSPKITVAIVAIAGLVLLGVLGAFDPLFDQDRVREFLEDSGPWGRAVYVSLFTVLQPISAPGGALIIPATFVWPDWQVFVLSWLGGVIASAVGFYAARWLGQDWVEERLPSRFRRWDERIAEHGTLAVFGLRVLTGFAPPADWLLGVSSAKGRQFWIGTIAGLGFSSAWITYLGDDGVRLLVDQIVWLGPLLVVAGVGLVVWLRRRRRTDGVDTGESQRVDRLGER